MEGKNVKTNAVNETLGLPLSDAFEHDLTAALNEADGISPVAIVMIDLDGFLQVNESVGYVGGDRVLIQTGQYLRESLPAEAKLYRYAGDCFSVLFPTGVEREEAFLTMETLRAGYAVKAPDGTEMTITIGVACAPEDGLQSNELVRKADGAMFRGKVNGRDRVCLAREEKMITKTSHYTVEQLQRLTKLSKREGIGEAILLREALDALLKKYDV